MTLEKEKGGIDRNQSTSLFPIPNLWFYGQSWRMEHGFQSYNQQKRKSCIPPGETLSACNEAVFSRFGIRSFLLAGLLLISKKLITKRAGSLPCVTPNPISLSILIRNPRHWIFVLSSRHNSIKILMEFLDLPWKCGRSRIFVGISRLSCILKAYNLVLSLCHLNI